MNRLKFWLFALLVLVLSALGLRTLDVELRKLGIWVVDRQLSASLARAESADRSIASELSAVAALAAQDGKLQAALRPAGAAAEPEAPGKKKPATPSPAVDPAQGDAALDQAASEAVSVAQAMLGAAQPGHVVMAVSRDGLSRRTGLDADALTFLKDAMERKVRRGNATLGGKVFVGAAVPVGEDGALAIFAPLDSTWTVEAVAGTGTTLILTAPGQKPVAGARLSEVDALAVAAGHGAGAVDAGRLGAVDISPPVLHVVLPLVHSFVGPLPADRILARPLEGVTGGQLLLAGSTKPFYSPLVKAEWYGAGLVAAAFVLALLFGFLVKPTEVTSPVPQLLLDAARKIERGDFSARVPVMAGKIGTVAEALNKAAEAAQAAPSLPPLPESDRAAFAGEPAEPGGLSDPFATSSRVLKTTEAVSEAKVVSDTARLDGANLASAAFEAAPLAAPRVPEPSPEPAPAPPPPPAAEPQAPAPAAAPAVRAVPTGEPAEDEQHWREVFRDFVRTRGECGESAEGLTYERFRQKLETNRSALVAKYSCKTVRFQVYVKEGKAALKATPIR